MDKKRIVIITGTGGILGTGHMQRMLNLAVHLNSRKNFSASIHSMQNEHPLPEKFHELLIDYIPESTDLIIRDMRDSSDEEILSLKKTAPVIAIDDSGSGRDSADCVLTLLPVPSETLKNVKPDKSIFLYGYNFAEGIDLLNSKKSLKRDIDIAVYAGYDPSPELVSSIIKSIPVSAFSVLLAGGKSILLSGENFPSDISYAEVISRTKIIITHFGLTMYEADACGCSIAALNPTTYHETLTGIVEPDFNIIYSSEYKSFSPDILRNAIEKKLESTAEVDIHIPEISNKINRGTATFIDYIEKNIL